MKTKLFTIILSAMIIGTSAFSLSGCGGENEKTATQDTAIATSDTATVDEIPTTETVTNETVPMDETDKAIVEAGLKVDKNGNVTDKNGNKIEADKNGNVKIKTDDGKTVTVSSSKVESANKVAKQNKSSSNKLNNTNKNSSSKSNSNSSSSNRNGSISSSSANKPNSSQNKTSSSSSSKSEDDRKTWHEAVYKTVNHPAETKVVNHPAETEEVKVIDKEAYTYEEPVYEIQGRCICKRCGLDITDNIDHIFDCNSSYKVEKQKVQVGIKTVTVPEEYHYETKVVKEAWTETVVVKEAWTEKVLVKEAGYY